MNPRRMGLTRHGPRLLKKVNGQAHAREQDHEDFASPNPKRQCRGEDKDAPSTSSQSQDTAGATKERISASPKSLDSADEDSERVMRGVEDQQNLAQSRKVPSKANKASHRRINARSSVRRAPPVAESQPDDDPPGFHSFSGNKFAHPRKTYGGNKVTKNIHEATRPDPKGEKAGKRQANGFHTPRSISLQRPGSISISKFKVPGKQETQDSDNDSSDSPSGKAELKKPPSPGSGFKNPSNYARKNSDPFLNSNDFKIPTSTLASRSDSSLSSPPDSVLLENEGDSVDLPLTSSQLVDDSPYAICPLCDETVDRSFLDEFSNYARRMSIRKQTLFCHAHRRRSAMEEYVAAGYPEIDWKKLPRRLRRHHEHIDDVLDRRKESWYRKELEERAKSGRLRTLHQTATATNDESSLHKFVPGYYGTKGARLMMESIINQFADKIRHLAALDDLLSLGGGGITGYAQSVLVPELAVCLIKEDMHVNDDEARKVLSESTKIGRLVHEEEEERVAITNDAVLENSGSRDEDNSELGENTMLDEDL